MWSDGSLTSSNVSAGKSGIFVFFRRRLRAIGEDGETYGSGGGGTEDGAAVELDDGVTGCSSGSPTGSIGVIAGTDGDEGGADPGPAEPGIPPGGIEGVAVRRHPRLRVCGLSVLFPNLHRGQLQQTRSRTL